MPLEKNAGALPGLLQRCRRSRCGHDPTLWKPSRRHERSRNLNAEVNALPKLHIVRLNNLEIIIFPAMADICD